jgi:multiple antibiotic resistance protein
MKWAELLTFSAAMFAVTNPLGNLAIFISLTSHRTHPQIRSISYKCGLAIAIALVTSVWLGNGLLKFFSISISGFEIAGGFVIVMIALSMLQLQKSLISHEKNEEKKLAASTKDSIAIVPMAIPIIAGPGAMTTAVVAGQHYATFADHVYLTLACLGLSVLITIILLFSTIITRLLGEEGVKIFTRIMGLLLMAIAFDLIVTGFRSAFHLV